MKHFKRICAAALTSAVLLSQTLTGGISAMAAETANTGADLQTNGLSETVEGGTILHCWFQHHPREHSRNRGSRLFGDPDLADL